MNIDCRSPSDRIDPGSNASLRVVGRRGSPGLEESLLGGVGRKPVIAQDVHRQGEHRAAETVIDGLYGRLISDPEALQHLTVHGSILPDREPWQSLTRTAGYEIKKGATLKIRTTALVMAGLMTIAACGSGPAESTSQESPDVTGGVATADTDLGTVLVDPSGFTMYVFTEDGNGESVCTDGCASVWPPVSGDTAIGTGLNASTFATSTRNDGTVQLTVGGRPLYTYSADANPGDTKGQDVNGVWFVVDPDGNLIETRAETQAESTSIDDSGGYGY